MCGVLLWRESERESVKKERIGKRSRAVRAVGQEETTTTSLEIDGGLGVTGGRWWDGAWGQGACKNGKDRRK